MQRTNRSLFATLLITLLLVSGTVVQAAQQVLSLAAGGQASVTCPTDLHVTGQATGQVVLECAAATAPTATVAPTSAPTSVPVSSSHPMGCAPGQVFLDSQAWWKNPKNPAQDFGHVHLGTCWNQGGTVKGTFTQRVRTVLHNNPGQFKEIRVQIFGSVPKPACNDSYAILCKKFDPPRTLATCAQTGGTVKDGGMTCVWEDDLVLNTTLFAYDGWQQFRFRTFVVEPDGKELRGSTGWYLYLNNGKPRQDNTSPGMANPETRGWYTNLNYENARIYNLPTTALKGVWNAKIKLAPGSGGKPTTHHYIALDTDFHNDNPGIAVHEGNGPFDGTVAIDTTKLANGWHRLFMKTDSFDSATGSTLSGVMMVYFEVKN